VLTKYNDKCRQHAGDGENHSGRSKPQTCAAARLCGQPGSVCTQPLAKNSYSKKVLYLLTPWLLPPRLSRVVLKLGKFMDPSPVTGSQPVDAAKPPAQQLGYGPAEQLLFPTVISWTKLLDNAYSVGLSQPMGPLPALSRAAFTRDTMPAKAGADAEVPLTALRPPPITTS
jgi:hypothetical protein